MSKNYLGITTKISIKICLVFVVVCSLSCSKKDDIKINKIESTEGKSVPFFELAKGDTVSKDIFREKPVFGKEEASILFSTEAETKRLKAAGVSQGFGPITNLYVSIRSDNNVGDWLWGGLRKFRQ